VLFLLLRLYGDIPMLQSDKKGTDKSKESLDASIILHVKQGRRVENFDDYLNAVRKLELERKDHTNREKNFISLVKLIELESLSKEVEYCRDFYLFLLGYKKNIDIPAVSYFFTKTYLAENPLSYSLTCMETVYTLYSERNLYINPIYLQRMKELLGDFNAKLMKNRDKYRKYSALQLLSILKQDYVDLKECFSSFTKVVDVDCIKIKKYILKNEDRH